MKGIGYCKEWTQKFAYSLQSMVQKWTLIVSELKLNWKQSNMLFIYNQSKIIEELVQ